MSLINQMLKDLDKRGSGVAGGEAAPGPVRAVQEPDRRRRWMATVVIVLLLAIGALVVWYFWKKPAPPEVKPTPPLPMANVDTPPAMPTVPAVAGNPSAPTATAEVPLAKSLASKGKRAEPSFSSGQPKDSAREPAAAAHTERAMKLAMSKTLESIPAPEMLPAKPSPKGAKKRAAASDSRSGFHKEYTSQQHAENAYSRAIAMIGAGQKAEAISALETLLLSHPKHAAARQTLVGLLLDAKRFNDAVRVLEEGLALDPKQTGMAMILARLQIEHAGPGIALATLQRSLPYAANRPDYLAFTAAMFQREKHHREAATYFAQALRKSPQNARWWMGYGISLQAQGQGQEARQAFIRARDLHKLTPALQAFVEQKISEL